MDTTLKRLFRARFDLGLFDPPAMVPYARTPEASSTARPTGIWRWRRPGESMVLLKNDGLLPLRPAPRSIAVIGPLADSERVLLGNYNGTPSRATTVLDGLRRQFPRARVGSRPGRRSCAPPAPCPPAPSGPRTESPA